MMFETPLFKISRRKLSALMLEQNVGTLAEVAERAGFSYSTIFNGLRKGMARTNLAKLAESFKARSIDLLEDNACQNEDAAVK